MSKVGSWTKKVFSEDQPFKYRCPLCGYGMTTRLCNSSLVGTIAVAICVNKYRCEAAHGHTPVRILDLLKKRKRIRRKGKS